MVKKYRQNMMRNISVKNKIINNWGLLSYLSTIVLVTILFISSVFIGGITWDEVYALPMIMTHFATALNNIPLMSNPEGQHLIYYGIINLLPGYVLSTIFSNYHTCSHIASYTMGVLASYYIYKVMILLGVRRNIAYLSGALLLLYPIWLGHSFFNDKDIPSAVFFILYSYYVSKVLQILFTNKTLSILLYAKLIITGALLAGTKFAFFPVIIVDSILLMLVYKSNVTAKFFFWCKIIIFTVFLTIVFTPGAWHQPITYMINDLSLMGKFNWVGCSRLLGECVMTNSPQWNSARYLALWYLVQTPLLFILLFISGVIAIGKVFLKPYIKKGITFPRDDITKRIWIVLLVQFLFIPLLAILHNSTFYNATRHTLFCIPIIVVIAGFGLEFVYSSLNGYINCIVMSVLGLLILSLIIDDILLNPYQYSYFNEISRYYINYKNTDTDYWGFSLRETYAGIDQIKYNTPYISMEHGPMPDTLTPFMSGKYMFVHYDKNIQLPPNVKINVIGLVNFGGIDKQINPGSCTLAAQTSRALLFKSDRLIMSKDYYCN